MQRHQRVMAQRHLMAAAQRVRVQRGCPVRRDNRAHKVAAPVARKHRLRDVKAAVGRIRAVAGRLADNRLAQIPAHARLPARARHLVLKVVHVQERRHAGEQHLRNAVLCAQVHQLRGHRLVFQREQEAAQAVRAVVAHRAEGHHGRMAVCIHKARQQNTAAAVDPLVDGGIARICAAAQRRNRIAADQQPAVPVLGKRVVHRQDPRVFKQRRHRIHLRKSIAAAQNT